MERNEMGDKNTNAKGAWPHLTWPHLTSTLTVKTTGVFHDRFLILDGKELYHFGASLKNLGRRYCAVSKMDAMFIPTIMERT